MRRNPYPLVLLQLTLTCTETHGQPDAVRKYVLSEPRTQRSGVSSGVAAYSAPLRARLGRKLEYQARQSAQFRRWPHEPILERRP
jgi:hypothetical protein